MPVRSGRHAARFQFRFGTVPVLALVVLLPVAAVSTRPAIVPVPDRFRSVRSADGSVPPSSRARPRRSCPMADPRRSMRAHARPAAESWRWIICLPRRSASSNARSAPSSWRSNFGQIPFVHEADDLTQAFDAMEPRSPDLICPSTCTCRSARSMSSIASTQRASNRCDAVCSFNHPTNGESSLYRSFDDIHPRCRPNRIARRYRRNARHAASLRVGSIALTFGANPAHAALSTRMVCAMGAT